MKLKDTLVCGYYEDDHTYVVEVSQDKLNQLEERPFEENRLIQLLKETFGKSDAKDIEIKLV